MHTIVSKMATIRDPKQILPRFSVTARSHAPIVMNGVLAAFFHAATVPAVVTPMILRSTKVAQK
ncbi:hypothetical protein PPTG_20141 [Phytophthora nicotianae INRA-310]|uniref:Uncharacterized protein n=1 Tax=Phytophthora nicotianae (strain INRA-310) TaxID=761204 RepID=W2PCB1_PHYN3|nr:hypothetical protein PPTG_20141 [Phytophthora nicotianae INRA-310]ETM97649.1 hypothetical protein PPTG_20141 [Phytophthora nicotianae INRA-310]